MQGPASPGSQSAGAGGRTWLSSRVAGRGERLAYGLVAAILVLVGVAGFGFALLSWSVGDLPFGLFGLAFGVPALVLGYRMLIAAAMGRRLYWWPGQREYDRRDTR